MIAIGDMGTVAEIDQLLGGQQLLHRPGHAEAADARIQNADGAVCVKHTLHDPFYSSARRPKWQTGRTEQSWSSYHRGRGG